MIHWLERFQTPITRWAKNASSQLGSRARDNCLSCAISSKGIPFALFRLVEPLHTNAKTMKRKSSPAAESAMRPEYDFSGAIRGKYYRRYLESTNVVVIEPDVHKRFKNSAAVNEALRTLIRAPVKRRGLTPMRPPPVKR